MTVGRDQAFPALICVAATLAVACTAVDEGPSWAAPWQSEVTKGDGVTTVRTLAGSVWGGVARLEEVLSIGVETGDDPYMLGNVRALGSFNGEIYVLDQQVPVVRVYDDAGRHVRDIGREGQGPGEFTTPRSMVIGRDGRIYVRDAQNGRINVFSPSGDDLGILSMPTGMNTPQPMVMVDDGTLYNFQPVNQAADFTEWRMGMVPVNAGPSAGTGPAEPPDFGFEALQLVARSGDSVSVSGVPFAPTLTWRLAPSGAIVAGVADDYSFDIVHRDGRVTRVERPWQPVPVEDDEASWARKTTIAGLRRMQPDWTWTGAEIPATKPAFNRFYPDHAGRIWVRRPGPGVRAMGECNEDPTPADPFGGTPCWTESVTWEVFDLEGRFLGPVAMPDGVDAYAAPYVTDNEILAAVADERGTVLIKRYRIVFPDR